MFYLEDLPYEVKTPKFIKVRGVIIVVAVIFLIIRVVGIYAAKNLQDNTIQSNVLEIADYQQKCNVLEADMKKFEEAETKELYNSWEAGNAVAGLQDTYGGISGNASVESVTESARNTASALDKYISDPFGRTPWYNNAACQYTWTYLNRQTSVTEKIPSIWICRSKNSNVILAVTTGVYDGLGELFGDFTVYYTTKGNAALDDNVRIVNGNIVSSVDYIDYYKNIDEVINEVSENIYQTERESLMDNAVQEEFDIVPADVVENNKDSSEEIP
ncbi:MAG: hypothetical protein K2G55_21040 [Lachnospiraceae bacterium]|nr:hypothetical protein [Lachnospiraceae bacterium]MDE7201059.1 hypothetical protein [Lachnospiraceae bacterium]